MELIVGVDIGNSTTEVAIGKTKDQQEVDFIAQGEYRTTGLKGTDENIEGIMEALRRALNSTDLEINDLDLIRLNEATPVIGDVAMETITETVITESTMIGHNPSTPGGVGLGVGKTVMINNLDSCSLGDEVIVVVPSEVDFAIAAKNINHGLKEGIEINGAIVQKDDAVLIANRIEKQIPIVDEVRFIDKVPLNRKAAVEVASSGGTIEELTNPYGIATVFDLDADETKHIVPVARSLIGNHSAVVIRTPQGDVEEKRIPAGKLIVFGERSKEEIAIDQGAKEIMESVEKAQPIDDIKGEAGTNVSGMLERVRSKMKKVTGQKLSNIKIKDILAVDTFVPQEVKGGLAGEHALENAVGLAAMVETSQLPMRQIADVLMKEISEVEVEIAGVEANMAILGALTTPGTDKPLVILDMGGGSTDAAVLTQEGNISTAHLSGAGNMVSMMIDTELGLGDFKLAERIKKTPLAKVESMFNIRHEEGTVDFYDEPLPPKLFSKVVSLDEGELVSIPTDHSMEKIRQVRRDAKKDVFVRNAVRALKRTIPTGNIRDIGFVVMVGGSALDFEVPELISNELSNYGVVAGRGNIRGTMGPRNAVATGLVLSYLNRQGWN
ncbi:diol dehydratase reactivase subunit alpha [Halanaerobaculum tunisiense]